MIDTTIVYLFQRYFPHFLTTDLLRKVGCLLIFLLFQNFSGLFFFLLSSLVCFINVQSISRANIKIYGCHTSYKTVVTWQSGLHTEEKTTRGSDPSGEKNTRLGGISSTRAHQKYHQQSLGDIREPIYFPSDSQWFHLSK